MSLKQSGTVCNNVDLLPTIILTLDVSTGLILIRIFVLWDRSVAVFRAVVIGIIVAYAACVPFLVLFSRKMHGKYWDIPRSFENLLPSIDGTVRVSGINVCAINIEAKFLIGVWLPQVINPQASMP